MGMGMNHWEWDGIGLKKTFQLISNRDWIDACVCVWYLWGFTTAGCAVVLLL